MEVRATAEAFLSAVGENTLQAWARVDPEQLLREADRLDAVPEAERAEMPLFGVPVGIKDNFDTADLPTAYGSPIYAGHRPEEDAAAVARLRAAGALIAGKTACAEFAWMTPPPTLNPIDPARTPGGSSNGSAAAVAAGHVTIATGSQTAGSINRPASYCGVLGFKPTFGRYDRAGVKLMSGTLDTVGLLARTVADLRAADLALVGPPATVPLSQPPRIAFAPTPYWSQIESGAAAAIHEYVTAAQLPVIELPGYERLAEAQALIQEVESARSLEPELREHADRLSEPLRTALAAGAATELQEFDAALAAIRTLGPPLSEILGGYDVVLTPSTTGVPPLGIDHTGDPLFSRVWTLVGAPSLSVPLVWRDGLPVGLQLVAPLGNDVAVLAAAELLLARRA